MCCWIYYWFVQFIVIFALFPSALKQSYFCLFYMSQRVCVKNLCDVLYNPTMLSSNLKFVIYDYLVNQLKLICNKALVEIKRLPVVFKIELCAFFTTYVIVLLAFKKIFISITAETNWITHGQNYMQCFLSWL